MKRYADSTVRKAARRMYGKAGLVVAADGTVERQHGGYWVDAVVWVNDEHVTGLSREESEAKS